MGVPPALVGRPLFPGSGTADNLTQNYPLRVLSGELLRHGRLPLWDPYIWSGTPLLAGWNAGSLYPGTWLFAILPAGAAWTINVASVSIDLRHRDARVPAPARLLTARGAAGRLDVHLHGVHVRAKPCTSGLVQGMSFTPWMLLAVHELATSPEPASGPALDLRYWAAAVGL